jgi:hypothetical protein
VLRNAAPRIVRALPHDAGTGIFVIDASHIAVPILPERGVRRSDARARR